MCSEGAPDFKEKAPKTLQSLAVKLTTPYDFFIFLSLFCASLKKIKKPKKEHSMGQSLARTWLHIVFSTKKREGFLMDAKIRNRVHRYLAGICRKLKCPARIVGGVSDHVHILCLLSPNVSVQELIRAIKRQSNVWIKKTWPEIDTFTWQRGYAVFSHSENHLPYVQSYIANQKKHHEGISFKEELLHLLRVHHVDFDEKYLWE